MKKPLLLATALLTGCANQPIEFSKAQPIPEQRLYAYQSENDATLKVTRDSGFIGAALRTDFYIDGVLAASFRPGESAVFGIPAGSRIIGAKAAAGRAGMLTERELNAKPGDTIRRRLTILIDHVDIMPTAH